MSLLIVWKGSSQNKFFQTKAIQISDILHKFEWKRKNSSEFLSRKNKTKTVADKHLK